MTVPVALMDVLQVTVLVLVAAGATAVVLTRAHVRQVLALSVYGVLLAVFVPRGAGQLLIGDDPGLRVGGHVRPVPVAAGLGRLAGVPGFRVYGGDHPVFGDLAGDPPPPGGAGPSGSRPARNPA